jgi:cbb3-type cytochrome oxidase subunit 3
MNNVLAHAGGADELALVALPLAVTALLLWWARRHAADEEAEASGNENSER